VSWYYAINQSMLIDKLCRYRIFRELNMHKLFYDARTRETDQTPWFRKDYVTEHRKAGGYATCRWIGQ
jgi:hypothetical protein